MSKQGRRAGGPNAAQSPVGVRGVMHRFPTPNVHEQIHAATASVVADVGYEQAEIAQICAISGVSLACFEEHFESKLQAVLSAVEAIADCVMADCHAVFASADDWPEAVWDAMAAITDWGACEPRFALLGVVELPKTGRQGKDLMRSLIDAFALFLAPGYEIAELETSSIDTTIGHELLELAREHILQESAETLPSMLPELTRRILSPFLGEREAEHIVAGRLAAERRAS